MVRKYQKYRLENALRLAKSEWKPTIVPILPYTKQPAIAWGELPHQDEAALRAYVYEHDYDFALRVDTARNHELNRRLVVFDIDDAEAYNLYGFERFPSPTVQTSRGYHVYFYASKNMPLGAVDKGESFQGIEVFTGKRLMQLAGNRHESGHIYEWAPGLAWDDVPVAPLPLEFSNKLLAIQRRKKEERERLAEQVRWQRRNNPPNPEHIGSILARILPPALVRIRSAPEGTSHDTVNREAYRVGRIISLEGGDVFEAIEPLTVAATERYARSKRRKTPELAYKHVYRALEDASHA